MMSPQPDIQDDPVAAARAIAASKTFAPRGTVRCLGIPLFRTQIARDLGCLLDFEFDVVSWTCLPTALGEGRAAYVPDFLVERESGTTIEDAVDGQVGAPASWIVETAHQAGHFYSATHSTQMNAGYRLQNARDLLRYARWHCPLGDRVRLLAALDEIGSMTVAECLPAFKETPPIAGFASLVLHRFIEVELDEARIGPETAVRRRRD
jgi:hypothetical protein